MSSGKILIPFDHTFETQFRVSDIGLKIAGLLDAQVILFHSYHPLASNIEELMHVSQLKQEEADKLQREKDRLELKYPNVPVRAIMELGYAAESIAELARKEDVDLIIMGTRGENDEFSGWTGTITSSVINEVTCDILVIPEEVRDLEFQEIMFSSDFQGAMSKDKYKTLLDLLDKTHATIRIVNVSGNREGDHAVPGKGEIAEYELFKPYKHSLHFLKGDDVQLQLLEYEQSADIDMMVVTTRHYSFWQKLVHKSITKDLALHTKKPLLVLHQRA